MNYSTQAPDYWQQATDDLSRRDVVMYELIHSYPDSFVKSRGSPFETLIRAVIGQQISVKAADAIWQRFNQQFSLQPKLLAHTKLSILREPGLSQRKAEYIQAISKFFLKNNIDNNYFAKRSDNEIIQELTSIHGIGRWSAEMFLIFTLRRPNIFPTDDIGLLRALEKHYSGKRLTPSLARKTYRNHFSPWCSVATWYLWRSLDPMEIQY